MKPGPKPKRIYKHEHEISIVWRDRNGVCNECRKEYKIARRKDLSKDSRIHQFCSQGHDTFLVGRDKSGACNECKIEWELLHKIEKKSGMKIIKKKFWPNKKNVMKLIRLKF